MPLGATVINEADDKHDSKIQTRVDYGGNQLLRGGQGVAVPEGYLFETTR